MKRNLANSTRMRHWALWVELVFVCIVVSGYASYYYSNKSRTAPVSVPQLQQHAEAPAKPSDGVSSRVQFVGDVFWGRSVQTKAEKSGQGYSHITSGLSTADRAQYDAWIGNFECPITTRDVPYQQQVDNLQFNCRPEYLPELAKWFTAASQANNHTNNNGGMWGLEQTRANLQANGIQYFGAYDMNQTNDLCEVVTMPATTTQTHAKTAIPVALCGYMYVVDGTPSDAQLAVMRQYARVMPVIAMPHMGEEYRPTAESAKVSAYHRMIDNGADMVVGAHPHVIQNSEAYKGRLIAYSVGNFLFDQQVLGRRETLGLGMGVRLTINDPVVAKIYEAVAPTCSAYKDDCLAVLLTHLKTRPRITVSYGFNCYDEAGGVPALGSAAACQQADEWATTSELSGLATNW